MQLNLVYLTLYNPAVLCYAQLILINLHVLISSLPFHDFPFFLTYPRRNLVFTHLFIDYSYGLERHFHLLPFLFILLFIQANPADSCQNYLLFLVQFPLENEINPNIALNSQILCKRILY